MNIQHVTFMANCILLLRLQTCRPVLQCSLWVLLVLSVHCLVVEDQAQAAQSQPMSGVGSNTIAEIRVPVGFDVTQVAGDELVTNVFSLAVSPQGEIFVAGPGYIKVLIDSNGDQVFDSTRQFARGPESGAQGMCFDGADLLCTGDGGLLRFVDADDDGFADGPAEKMFSITTGGEHDAHAIRKGPDGWWYLLAGNGTKILPEYFSGKHSPVKNPRAGFLMRISPDWTEKEVFAHGFRNAYDFDFNTRGQVFVYDSDGERDISLPWYRPTRLFQIRAGDDAGWVTASWKRPSYFFDMPMEIGNLGRGSPTGVSNCQSKTFPSSYQDAVFVADWTFGRVVAFRRINSTGEYDRGTDFAIATGQFGFAVTDLDFAKDGSLLISAGGRGTKGAIYRVRYVGESDDRATPHRPAVEVDIKKGKLEFSSLIAALGDSDPAVRNVALESLVGREELMRSSKTDGAEFYSGLLGGLANAFQSASPQTLPLLIQIDRQLDVRLHEELAQMRLPIESQLALALRDSGIAAVEKAIAALSKGQGDPLVVARLGQLLLGGEDANSIPMFVGYSAKNPIELKRAQSTMVANELATAIARIGQRTDAERKSEILAEVGRLVAMLECSSPRLQKEMIALARVGSAQQSIHWLNCLSQTINDREKKLEPQFVAVVSETLAAVTKKIKRDNQDIDRNFYPRMKDLANRLCQRVGDEFSISLAKQLTGEAEEIYLVDVLPEKSRLVAVSKFADRIAADRENVTVNQLRVLLNSDAESCLRLLRTFADQKNLRSVVVEGISRSPIPTDQTLLAESLESFDPTTIKNSAIGLRRLGRSKRWQCFGVSRWPSGASCLGSAINIG